MNAFYYDYFDNVVLRPRKIFVLTIYTIKCIKGVILLKDTITLFKNSKLSMVKTIAVAYKIENSGTVAWRAVTTARVDYIPPVSVQEFGLIY